MKNVWLGYNEDEKSRCQVKSEEVGLFMLYIANSRKLPTYVRSSVFPRHFPWVPRAPMLEPSELRSWSSELWHLYLHGLAKYLRGKIAPMSNARLVPTFYGCRSGLAPASTLPRFGLRTLVNFVGLCGSLSFIFYWIAVLVFAASAMFMKICPCIASRYSAY